MQIKIVCIFISINMLACACVTACHNKKPGTVQAIKKGGDMDNANNTETKQLKIQDSFEVSIDSRGALGLQLLYRVDNNDVVEVTKAAGEANNTNPPLPGNAVAASFTIKALKAGNATITFYETKPWEKNFADIIKKQIKVQVSD